MPAQKKQPRLKESCDSCSTAKVRCTKEKTCSRCQQKGLPCSYSYSRRAGRKTTASLVSKVDRRPRSPSSRGSSPTPFDSTPSASSSLDDDSPQLPDFSPDSDASDFDLWASNPTYHQSGNPFSWDLQNSLLNQYALPIPLDPTSIAPPAAMIPTSFDAMDTSTPINSAPMMARNFSTATNLTDMTDLTLASDISSSSSSASSASASSAMYEAVHSELSHLTSFAEGMEKKFDAVVRARLQYRDVYSEFGVPVDDIEGSLSSSSSSSPAAAAERILGAGGVQAGKGGVPSPDCNELAFYYSLAELKRRLKWVREDVGSLMMGGGGTAQESLLI